MREVKERVDVLVAGGGTAGHIAAIQAARAGALTSVIEADSMLGGTMTVGGIYTPCFFFGPAGQVVSGIPWELFCKSKQLEGLPIPDHRKRRPVETPGFYNYYIDMHSEQGCDVIRSCGALLCGSGSRS